MIESYGGSDGLRDLGLLQAAVGAPQATFDGILLHNGLHEMAAAYLFHLVSNHPFVDGNKRTGAAVAIIFLILNGHTISSDQDGLYEITLKVAAGAGDKSEIVSFLRKISRPADNS